MVSHDGENAVLNTSVHLSFSGAVSSRSVLDCFVVYTRAGFPKLSCTTDPFLRVKFTADPTFKLR